MWLPVFFHIQIKVQLSWRQTLCSFFILKCTKYFQQYFCTITISLKHKQTQLLPAGFVEFNSFMCLQGSAIRGPPLGLWSGNTKSRSGSDPIWRWTRRRPRNQEERQLRGPTAGAREVAAQRTGLQPCWGPRGVCPLRATGPPHFHLQLIETSPLQLQVSSYRDSFTLKKSSIYLPRP